MDRSSFDSLYKTVYNYLNYLDLIKEEYKPEFGEKKFNQYDYNKN